MSNSHSEVELGFYDFDDCITTYVTQGLFACLSHDYEKAAEWFARACHASIDHGDSNATLIATLLTAFAQEENGADIEGAIRSLDLAQRVAEESQLEQCSLKLHLWRGRLHVANGEFDLARESCRIAAESASELGEGDRAEELRSLGDKWADGGTGGTEEIDPKT